jgi:hypothetical protein
MTQYPLIQEGDLLVFEWGFLIDPQQSLSVTRSTAAQGELFGKQYRGVSSL